MAGPEETARLQHAVVSQLHRSGVARDSGSSFSLCHVSHFLPRGSAALTARRAACRDGDGLWLHKVQGLSISPRSEIRDSRRVTSICLLDRFLTPALFLHAEFHMGLSVLAHNTGGLL